MIHVLPSMSVVLIWISFSLVAMLFLGMWGYVFLREARWDTRPQDLKTFSDMKRAFRTGSKTKFVDRRRSSAVFAMRVLAEQSTDPVQRETIALLMRDSIVEVLHKSDNRTANSVSAMLETLATAAPSWEADFLEQVSCSQLEGWVRGDVIQRLVRLRGRESVTFLLALADDPPVAPAVAAPIAYLGPEAATPEVIARLQRMLGETRENWAPPAAARALITLGQATNPILTEYLDKFDPWTRFVVRVKAAELDALALTDRLFAAAVVGEHRRKSIKPSMITKMQKALDTGDGFKAVTTFLQRMRAVYSFDTEWNPVPDYGQLLSELSRIGARRVTISDIQVELEGEVCREVNCRIAGHPARFNPSFMGDWTDLEAVLGGLNAGLAAAGRLERFANLNSGGQDAYVIIGHAAGLASLVKTLGLPLDPNVNAAIAVGIAAENHMAEQIKAELPGCKIVR
jgi:hypothetical protein